MVEKEVRKPLSGRNARTLFKICLGESLPWLALIITVVIFLCCRAYPSKTEFDIWSLALIPLYCAFTIWLFGNALISNPRLSNRKKWTYSALTMLIICLGTFVCGRFKVTVLVLGSTVIILATCCLACLNSWLFRFRSGRLIGLFLIFMASSVLYHKLGLKTEKCSYDKDTIVEPIHIANQLIGVALPDRGYLEKYSSTAKPLLYEGCHFFIWVFVFSLLISFSNRELVNRLYLKLTCLKPMYVFWSEKGNEAEECIAESILAQYKVFKPNVVLVLWGKDKEIAADICDKWTRGRRWVEATSHAYDDILSHGDVHYVFASEGMKNIQKTMELMKHIKSGNVYVRLDDVDNRYRDAFGEYVRLTLTADLKSKVQVFGVREHRLASRDLDMVKRAFEDAQDAKLIDGAFVVNYYHYEEILNQVNAKIDNQIGRELNYAEKIAQHLEVKCLTRQDRLRDEFQYGLLFFGEDKYKLMILLEEFKTRILGKENVYVYVSDPLIAEMLRVCYSVKIVGAKGLLFTEDNIAQVARDLRQPTVHDMSSAAPSSAAIP